MRSCAAILSIMLPALVFSAPLLAGNLQPTLYLEIYGFEQDPTDTLPDYVCTHPENTYPIYLPCSAAKSPYGYGFLAIHVGRLDNPTCPTVGPQCFQYGGYAGLCFGVIHTGQPALYMSFNACPGFLVGYGGGAADIMVTSAGACHDWHDHPGYLKYVNLSPNTERTYFRIVENSSLGFLKVINCSMEYDYSTEIDGCVAWGGTVYDPSECYFQHMAEYFCGFTPVEATTWGAMKTLYR